ncbi:putative bifunctional diguanylate cyclase/phosphodiesterase [Hydrogenovibrio thermophilus]|uniref:cyclic-guanylate-specific phosphodiesterase n=1 Tax=Hydrogenovibrio thermophilus TaxID=265883 RepID=A0A410H5M0_9GAMM|nr:EAL domain-containing protein [Hydrogenovibrio thermophilus]QAB16197.1 EAL domain-containing protein [Hydrogenovibrio thermophilus]
MISIRRFFITAIVALVLVFYGVFLYYFLNDQQKKTDLILENIRHDLSETAYVVSTEMATPQELREFKSFLHRKVANNPLVAAMAIASGSKILITTEHDIRSAPPKKNTQDKLKGLSAHEMLRYDIYETDIPYFIQNQPAYLKLYLYIDKAYLENYFAENTTNSLLFFGVVPLLLLGLLWGLLKRFVTNPLELLRQYAYYQSEIPKRFKLRELEYIRASMVQTFTRLDEEKSELYRLARTDNLSGLANRNHLNERLNWLISEFSRSGQEFALLFMDLDNFKTVNDTLGHEVGDKLLRNVSSLIKQVLRDYDIIARVGGDEFVIVVNHHGNEHELINIIQRVIEKISDVHLVDNHPVKVSASVGVVLYPKDGQSITTLMKNADIAMYEAKNAGKNQFKFFTESLHQQLVHEIELENNMQRALDNGEFELYYQPKISVTTGQVTGAEALIRWIDPNKGVITPDRFIPSAEKSGLMVPLGDWVLETAVRQQIDWKKRGLGDFQVSVNLSPVQLINNHFEEKLNRLIQESGITPSKLDVEMTESQFMENSEQNLSLLHAIQQKGISISLDDFGTGYSSLAYLKKFPINTLKIDKTFMDDYDTESGAIFIETIIKIAQTLNLNVVAEGIEHPEQLDYLVKTGCETYQGFFCSRPLPAAEFEKFLTMEKSCCH